MKGREGWIKGGVEGMGGRGEGRGQRRRAEETRETLCVSVSMFASTRSFPSQWNLTVVFSSLELRSMWREKPRALLLSPLSLPLSILPSSSSHLPESRPPPPSKFLFMCQHAAALQLFPVSPRVHLPSRGQKMEETLPSQRSPFPGQAL